VLIPNPTRLIRNQRKIEELQPGLLVGLTPPRRGELVKLPATWREKKADIETLYKTKPKQKKTKKMNDGGLTMDCEDTQQLLIVDDLVSTFIKLHFLNFVTGPVAEIS
jgi:hypothetical protein